MTLRAHTLSCLQCRMHLHLCLCDTTPQLDLKTRVVIFMHQKEFRLITNTGVLAQRVLKNSQMVFRGHPDRRVPQREDFLSPGENHRTFILFPTGEGGELNQDFVKTHPGPLTLIFPDGHWGQAKKTVRHEPSLAGLSCLRLPEGLVTNYRLRRNLVPGRVCTVEAIARALGIIEGEAVQNQMEDIFERMVSRVLWTRGRIKEEQMVW